jgi:hypothetical protein
VDGRTLAPRGRGCGVKWTSVRIDVDAAARLEKYRVGLERAVAGGTVPHPRELGKTRVSLAEALCQLINGIDGHRARAKAAKVKAKTLKAGRLASRSADIDQDVMS